MPDTAVNAPPQVLRSPESLPGGADSATPDLDTSAHPSCTLDDYNKQHLCIHGRSSPDTRSEHRKHVRSDSTSHEPPHADSIRSAPMLPAFTAMASVTPDAKHICVCIYICYLFLFVTCLHRQAIRARLKPLQEFWLARPSPSRRIENSTGMASRCEEGHGRI